LSPSKLPFPQLVDFCLCFFFALLTMNGQ
jgi:hypothetical protein